MSESGFNRPDGICRTGYDYFSLQLCYFTLRHSYCPSRGTVIYLSVEKGQLKGIHIIITHTSVVME